MKKVILNSAGVLALTVAFSTAHAATTWTGNTDSDWLTPSNWGSGLPDGNDNTFLLGAGAGTTTLTGGNATVDALQVRSGHVLTVDNAGFTLQVDQNDNINLGQGAAGDGSSIVHLNGTVNGTGSLAMSGNATGGTSFYTLSGGILNLDGLSMGAEHDATFAIQGDSATVEVAGPLNANANAIFDFTFGASGMDTIDSIGAFTLVSGASLNINGSSYTGGEGSITLFSYASRADATEFAETISGFAGLTGDVVYSGSSIILELTAAIPEPSTLALLGMGAGTMVLFRRKQRA